MCSLKLRGKPDLTKGPLSEVKKITSIDIVLYHGSLSTGPLSHYQQTYLSQAKSQSIIQGKTRRRRGYKLLEVIC